MTQELSVNIAANQYTLTLDANGGAFADNSTTKTKTVAYKGTYGDLDAPARGGYAFDGWFTAKTDGAKVEADHTVEVTENTTIYAHWTANTYKVKYDANGGTGSMADQTLTYDTEITLSANAFTRTGYTFNGWKDANGTTYADKAKVKNLAESGTVTLYAQWKANTYTIQYNGNGGSGTMSATTATYDQNVTLPENKFTYFGHVFNGWNTKADGTGTSYADKTTVKNLTDGGVITLYAQ